MIITIVIISIMGDARVRVRVVDNSGFRIDARGTVKVVANPGFGDRRCQCPCVVWRPWRMIDGTVRGPRSMAPCVATARDSEVFSDDLHGKKQYKRCRRESHSSGVSPVRRFPVSVRCPWCVRGVSVVGAIDGTVRGPGKV